MNLENLVRGIVSDAVTEYLPAKSDLVSTAIGSTAASGSGVLFEVPAEASGRHVHLSPEDVEKLFGPGHTLTPKRPLSQPNQFLAEERVTLIGPNGTFKNVAVLGPPRGHTQVEVSASDARTLGLQPPVALSGDLSQAGDMLIASKDAFLMAEQSLIIARNHIHMSPEEALAAGVADGDLVDVRMCTDRPVTFNDVVIRSGPAHKLALHIDFDEANACGFQKGCKALIIGKKCCGSTPIPEPRLPQEPFTEGEISPGDVVISTRFLSETQVKEAIAAGASSVMVSEKTIVSPLAQDLLSKRGVQLKRM